MDERYNPAVIEAKWQRRWEEGATNVLDLKAAKRPYYALMMFPYPSAEGLHVGNAFAFSGVDIHGRLRRLQGYDVFEPIGFDAFGIHSENYALSIGRNPMQLMRETVVNFRRQLKRLGLMLNWEHAVDTTSPEYYRWTQWIFLQLYHHGLAVRKKAPVNWCPRCQTVVANEQVINGCCERHRETLVEQRVLEQWFFTITKYAQRLLDNLSWIDWSETTKTAQRNWIGRSEGADIDFPLEADRSRAVRVFTTRPDTLFGATYMVLAPEHPWVEELASPTQRESVTAYCDRVAKMDLVSRRAVKEKTGVFTGGYVINPATGTRIPIWIADYVLIEYGTGAIMAVPAHDERDFEFASVFGLPIQRVIAAEDEGPETPVSQAYVGPGRLVNSGEFSGLDWEHGKHAITEWLSERGHGAARIQYRLHDWCVSRQRYWGPPIPMIYCDQCGIVPVPEKDLPVILPEVQEFRPDVGGMAPLARVESFYRVPCPSCGRLARRETDVSDTFLDSAWYFLRYPSADRNDVAFDQWLTGRWLPVDTYIGGNEHAVLHLLYSRFITMALHDLGFLPFEEPFKKFRAHGLIIKEGSKMSKSRGNVVTPDAYVDEHGADVFRLYLMFLGPYQEGGDFRDEGVTGIRRFLDAVWRTVREHEPERQVPDPLLRATHKTILKVTEDLEGLHYNTAIAALMSLINEVRRHGPANREICEALVLMLSPMAPHIAEELWEAMGHRGGISEARWPVFDDALTRDEEIELAVQVNGKVRGRIQVPADAVDEAVLAAALAEAGVRASIGDKPIKRRVIVPGRLVSLVV